MKSRIAPTAKIFRKGVKGISVKFRCRECQTIRVSARIEGASNSHFDTPVMKCKTCGCEKVHDRVLDSL